MLSLPLRAQPRRLCSAACSCSQHRPSGLAPGRRQLGGCCAGWRFLRKAATGCPLPAGLAQPPARSPSRGKGALRCLVVPASLLDTENSCSPPLGPLGDVCVLRVREKSRRLCAALVGIHFCCLLTAKARRGEGPGPLQPPGDCVALWAMWSSGLLSLQLQPCCCPWPCTRADDPAVISPASSIPIARSPPALTTAAFSFPGAMSGLESQARCHDSANPILPCCYPASRIHFNQGDALRTTSAGF